MEDLYKNLSGLANLDLAGSQFSRQDLGIDAASNAVKPFRQPVQDLAALLESSARLEKTLDELYAKDPLQADLAAFETDCNALLLDQQILVSKAAANAANLPQPLLLVFESWQKGLNGRTVFIQDLLSWWKYAAMAEQSLASASNDRATARRYTEDSLKEENVETAYIWTKTALEYRASMNTAIDFANIYIGRTNKQIIELTNIRQTYRSDMGLAVAGRQLDELAYIKADAFWLAS